MSIKIFLKTRYFECMIMPMKLPTAMFWEFNWDILKVKTGKRWGGFYKMFCKMIAKLEEHVNLIIQKQNLYTIMSASQPLQSYTHLNVCTWLSLKSR
jgi:hypothetical protein